MATATNPKTYTYHVTKNGVFQGILTNVISDFAYQQEINSAGSNMTIVLGTAADSFGEGSLIDFNNNVKVYEIDDENPNGILIFQGFIMNYKPIYSDTNQEQVEVVVMGYGATFNDYIIESGEVTDVNHASQNSNNLVASPSDSKSGAYGTVIQSFTTGGSITKLSAISLWIAAVVGTDIGSECLVQVYASRTDAEGPATTTPIASAQLPITSLTAAVYRFNFASPVTVSPGTQYWIRITNTDSKVATGFSQGFAISYDSSSLLSGQTLEQNNFNGASWGSPFSTTGSLYLVTYSSTGNTQATYTAQDPSVILKSIIDNYNAQGGLITYTAASIDLTGTSVTYPFNANTVLEGVNKCSDMAPPGWYWYIDQVNNVIHFHHQSSTPQHTFMLGKNIKNLSVEKRAQELVNIVYFIGGPTGGVNLYQKSVLQSSIDLYGRRAIRYNDNNVTNAATATIIANGILTERAQAELRIDLDLLDNGGQAASIFGFDIESIVLGESVAFRSIGTSTGASLWDVAKWDQAKWDFDITDLTSVVIQVTKIDYSPDVLHLSLSSVPPDITKRVEYIWRGLQQVTALSNPSTPS